MGSQTEPSIPKQRHKNLVGAGPRKHTAGVVVAELGADTVKSLTGVAAAGRLSWYRSCEQMKE